jgi:putative DNA primase/helicase
LEVPINYDNIPEVLKQRKQWVCFKWEDLINDAHPEGIRVKLPINPAGGAKARTNDPSTWGTFESASKMAYRYDGIGFMFSDEDPFTVVDLDHCMDETGTIKDEARTIVNDLNSYSEISTSGKGVHVIIDARKPGLRCRESKLHPDIEIYEKLRFLVVTGDIVPGSLGTIQPAQNELDALYFSIFGTDKGEDSKADKMAAGSGLALSDEEILVKAAKAKNGDMFGRLMAGDASDYHNDLSSADMGLLNILAFWTGKDQAQMDRIYRISSLYRDKWDEDRPGGTYGSKSIQKACDDTMEVYTRKTLRADAPKDPSAERPKRAWTEMGMAERLIDTYGDDLLYSFTEKSWLIWDKKRWAYDVTGEIDRRAKTAVRNLAAEGEEIDPDEEGLKKAFKAFSNKCETYNKIISIVKLARSEPGIPVIAEDLDTDPWLINCNNGTLDLRNSELSDPLRKNLITKLAPVDYDPKAECPTWLKFLDSVFEGKADLIAFIKRALGYALTGDVREQSLFFLYGTGSNGKSTLLEVISDILGDYAQTTSAETLLSKDRQGGNSATEIADLKGSRFVSAAEADAGRKMAEALVKQLTGSDTVTARRLYQNFFTFKPTAKIFLAVNHKPIVQGADPAIWRRIKLIPFNKKFEGAEKDPTLPVKLRQELPGIFRWIVEGCQEWLQRGLDPPDEVLLATDEYRSDMDQMAPFIAEMCITGRSALCVKVKELYTNYVEYCERNKEHAISPRMFTTRMTERDGIKKDPKPTTGGFYWYHGIGLKNFSEEGQQSQLETDETQFSEKVLENGQQSQQSQLDPLIERESMVDDDTLLLGDGSQTVAVVDLVDFQTSSQELYRKKKEDIGDSVLQKTLGNDSESQQSQLLQKTETLSESGQQSQQSQLRQAKPHYWQDQDEVEI